MPRRTLCVVFAVTRKSSFWFGKTLSEPVQDQPEPPVFGPENIKAIPRSTHRVSAWRSMVKAVSWRAIGTLDTLVLSYLLITYLGPLFGFQLPAEDALRTASYIAITEVVTKMVLYFVHERVWGRIRWGLVARGERKRETNRRSGLKTATWRTIASLDTFALAWFFTGSVATAVSIGGIEIITKLVLYFFHERAWARVHWGIVHRTEDTA